jgi:superfamily II DNA/RNA helicase
MRLHRHQAEAIAAARERANYVLTTGTGSGKSLAYIIPIVDSALRTPGPGIKAIVVYPMNALANSQLGELEKFLSFGYPDGRGPVSYARYTGQESEDDRKLIAQSPPDILLTNYVMLELLLSRVTAIDKAIVTAAEGLRFLVLDELHTYRGRQGADVALLVRRTRERCRAPDLQHVGTSATMATGGTFDEQRAQVAKVASTLFGATVAPEHVIGETLRRATTGEPDGPIDITREPPLDYETFIADPLAAWIESTFGISEVDGRLVRTRPRTIADAATELAAKTGVPEDVCASAVERFLMAGSREENREVSTGFPVFAFRLHQFISRGETVYATLELPDVRNVTTTHQHYVPGDRDRILFPLAFCRECGQEYYVVTHKLEADGAKVELREFGDRPDGAALLYIGDWSAGDLPPDWLDDRGKPQSTFKDYLPVEVGVDTLGVIGGGVGAWLLRTPLRLCLHCGVTYTGAQRNEFAALATLNAGGRSTATSVLSLSAIRQLKHSDLETRAQKLLSFTDNRQDAALQAGHFNDFVEVSLLRSALYRATKNAAPDGLTHDVLTRKVAEALALPTNLYAANPDLRFAAKEATDKAFRDVIGYRLYLDLRRGWRLTSPNLEQSGLLLIDYVSLDDLAAAEDIWEQAHPALQSADPKTRAALCRTLLDHMRRELAIQVDYLDQTFQESLASSSRQHLRDPWIYDESEQPMEHATVIVARSRRPGDYRGWTYLSARTRFAQYLRRSTTFPAWAGPLRIKDTEEMLPQLLTALSTAGLVQQDVQQGEPTYQVLASGMRWVAGDGSVAFRDPIRVPNAPEAGSRSNEFFVRHYQELAADARGIRAAEHTAAVPAEERQQRENAFRAGELPILYCSPTMELGVDIAELNVVNMRNVPPTPANYAQRSGRAGRSGQPALVFTYCTSGSPHDQFYFRRPQQMVAGQVTPPRLDVANEDLVRAHVYAIWLAHAGLWLGRSLKDVLDVEGESPSLELMPNVRNDLERIDPRTRTIATAKAVLADLAGDLVASDWWDDGWLDHTVNAVAQQFERACDRWRGLYRGALKQQETQNDIVKNAGTTYAARQQAQKLRREAEAQMHLLVADDDRLMQSDFYSYRYFASEGFLPGYSFPRLPLSAFIPARRVRGEEYLQRPRFIAISEFGPQAIIYHAGARYVVNRVNLPVDEERDGNVLTQAAKRCRSCGYLNEAETDVCRRCVAQLDPALPNLFRLSNVSTRRRDRINSDEEERQRQGYEIQTAVRWARKDGVELMKRATIEHNDEPVASLQYGHAATLWRINLGWRRSYPNEIGFMLDTGNGYWAKAKDDDSGPDDPLTATRARVVPFVEDRRNALLVEPANPLSAAEMASLQSALKHAIQVVYQLEDSELAAEPLPTPDTRRLVLLYEAAEGGAGVLRRIASDPGELARVARAALDVCHFEPDTGADLDHAPHATERCEAACYDCLLSYTNQPDHQILDRHAIRDQLLTLAAASVKPADGAGTRTEQLNRLKVICGSNLERAWLDVVDANGFTLPDDSQVLIEHSRPDFLYREPHFVAVFVDGPHHENTTERDEAAAKRLDAAGWQVLRFDYKTRDSWGEELARHPGVFGTP